MSTDSQLHQVQPQCVVALTWVMTDSLGEELDTLDEPAEFLVGGVDLLAKIDEALQAKFVGEVLNLYLEPQDAFGDYIEQLVYFAPRDKFPEQLEEGMLFEGLPPGCNPDAPKDVVFHVTDIYPEHVVLDGNHPLAGMSLKIRIKIESIREATIEEIGKGSAGVGFFKMQAFDESALASSGQDDDHDHDHEHNESDPNASAQHRHLH
jgi:FKBP-type peptidyl-prolyl cis-trans isomerase SlyD